MNKQKISSKQDVAIHVRRNDYLKLGIELNLKYYTESIRYLENKLENFKFDVFTDDKKWVLEQSIFLIVTIYMTALMSLSQLFK